MAQGRSAAHPRLAPDRTFLFDAPAAITLARIAGRGRRLDRFESENGAYFERVRQGYLDIAQQEPERLRVIDASVSEPAVAAAVARELDALLAAPVK